MNRKAIGLPVVLTIPTFALLAGCPVAPPGSGGVSDVPCFRPAAWPEGATGFWVRMESSAAMLMAHRTSEQAREDRRDLIAGNGAHGPVYRFDATQETFELVDHQVWDDAAGTVIGCTGQLASDSPFVLRQAGTGRMLLFNDQEVPVVGGVAVSVWAGPDIFQVAVVSATGGGGIPFLSNVTSSGQHYHQLYSEINGEPIGDPVRLPFSGTPLAPQGCRGPGGGFMLYSESSNGRFERICIVDVREFAPQVSTGDEPARLPALPDTKPSPQAPR